MDVHRPSGPSKPEYQTAWSILVFWVVLYHPAEFDRFTDSMMLWTACRSSGIGGIGNGAGDCCAHQTLVAVPRNRLLVSEKG